MSNIIKNLSSPLATGGAGHCFEAHVQASFVVLMLTKGYAPCLPCWPITAVKLQGKIDGYDTDDLIVYVEKDNKKRKMLGQVKSSISINNSDKDFSNVIQAAWSDFNKPELFKENNDIIALITGPLSASDMQNVQWLLNHARNTVEPNEFFRDVEQANFSPSKAKEKLDVFRYHLNNANKGIDVSEVMLYSFLRHFFILGYDLGREEGVVLSLLQSHVSQYNTSHPEWVWSRIVEIVQVRNQSAGTITSTNIPEDLVEAFKLPTYQQIPSDLIVIQKTEEVQNWNQHKYAGDLALANIVGSWNEHNTDDQVIMSSIILADSYKNWIDKIREILQLERSPISHRNGIWKINNRTFLWTTMGSRIFDDTLDRFKSLALDILSECDPSFDLPKEDRFASSVRGKTLKYSPSLREGVAEGLALLGSKPNELIYCTPNRAEVIAAMTIHELFRDSDWIVWGSLNDLLPLLAEAAPDEFIKAIEHSLQQSPCPFEELFLQESDGITGKNYLTGLLWALEVLAWDEKYLIRSCVVLGEIAQLDPGGKWANRPVNSITTILLPWLPQTTASFEKRKIAIDTLIREQPDIAWKIIISLLPNQSQISTGSYKPSFRKYIPDDWSNTITQKDYKDQITVYLELAISMSGQDISKMAQLVDHLDNFPSSVIDKFINVISSEEVLQLPENDRLIMWNRLKKFTTKHKKFSDAKWALPTSLISKIERVSEKMSPNNIQNLYRNLFSDRDFDLYESKNDWRGEEKKLEDRRQAALRQIISAGGIEDILLFSKTVESPFKVGCSMGNIGNLDMDIFLLPENLCTGNKGIDYLVSGYIWQRYYANGQQWIDQYKNETWNTAQKSQFLFNLPFMKEIWDFAEEWLGEQVEEYWTKVNVRPYQATGDRNIAIDNLLLCGRPCAAISCLSSMLFDKMPIDVSQSVTALIKAVSTSEPVNSLDVYDAIEIIKYLQEDPDTNVNDLSRIEWSYLLVLDRSSGAYPKMLEKRLSEDPENFCETIRLIYRSNKQEESRLESSKDASAIAMNAWRLLNNWRTPPGTNTDGEFDEGAFEDWLRRIKDSCNESGHLEAALIKAGAVLIYSPPDPNGLWIHRSIANALNALDAEKMRNGFKTALINSRGVHWVDPTGNEERELAKQYLVKAEAVENEGYQRLAVLLREVSDNYIREADENERESKEEI